MDKFNVQMSEITSFMSQPYLERYDLRAARLELPKLSSIEIGKGGILCLVGHIPIPNTEQGNVISLLPETTYSQEGPGLPKYQVLDLEKIYL